MMVTLRCWPRALAASGPRTAPAPGSSRAELNAKNSSAGTVVRDRPCGPWTDVTGGNGTTGTGVVLRERGSGRVTRSTAQDAAPAAWQMASQYRVSSVRWGSGSAGCRPAVSPSPENTTCQPVRLGSSPRLRSLTAVARGPAPQPTCLRSNPPAVDSPDDRTSKVPGRDVTRTARVIMDTRSNGLLAASRVRSC